MLITSPNNPTGTAIRHDELVAVLDAVPPTTLVVLDEAYHEYITGLHAPRAMELLRRYPNLAVLRTFSKAYGLAALRIGYADGAPTGRQGGRSGAHAVRRQRPRPGRRARPRSRHDDELRERVAVTLAERARVQAALRHLGFSTPDAQANFVWLPAGEAAAALTLKLETLGVVTRPFPDEGVRVTIGTPSENDHFLDAFEAAVEPLELAAHWGLPTGRLAGAVQGWVDRIDAADTRLLAHAGITHHGLTDPDPGGTEQWDSDQVWAHLAEIGATGWASWSTSSTRPAPSRWPSGA